MTNKEFVTSVVPARLQELKADTEPKWGRMTLEQMLDHLRIGVVLSIENTEDEITTPPERLPLYKDYLMSDKPFKEGLPKPEAYNRVAPRTGNIEELKVNLLNELKRMENFFNENPDHTAIHPNFGELNIEEWYQLHKKHFAHHFTQFGLL